MARGTPALHSHCTGKLQELKANYALQAGPWAAREGQKSKVPSLVCTQMGVFLIAFCNTVAWYHLLYRLGNAPAAERNMSVLESTLSFFHVVVVVG